MERLVSTISFPRQAVKVLTDSDFNLDSSEPITIKWSDCIIVLFYGNNEESLQLAQIWQIAAQIAAGTLFAAVNLDVHPKIAEAFMRVKNTNSPYRPFAMQGYPFILTYQNGFPIGFYNGERAVQPIVDYSLTLACQPNYFEPIQYASGVSTRYNYEMAGYKYHQPAKSSLQFTANDSFRGYNPADRVVLSGSPAAAQLAQQQHAIDTRQGIQISSTGTGTGTGTDTGFSQRLTGAPVSEFRPADEPIMAEERAERAEPTSEERGEQATTRVLTPIELARLYREQREREQIPDGRGEAEQRAREEAQILAQQREEQRAELQQEESGKKNTESNVTPEQPAQQPDETQDLEQAVLLQQLLGEGKRGEEKTGPRRLEEEEVERRRLEEEEVERKRVEEEEVERKRVEEEGDGERVEEGQGEGDGERLENEGEQAVEDVGKVGEEAADEAGKVGEEAVGEGEKVGEEAGKVGEEAVGEEERARLAEEQRTRLAEEERTRLEEEERARLEEEEEQRARLAEEEKGKGEGKGEKSSGIEDVESEAGGDFGELGEVLEVAV